ncbi:MAG: sulfite exporter TauE/SafE family protein [Bacteroidales bacterium]|nr:sulfite exporter TauE/SafE family protein [Bacteroidales bacterium]
MTFYIFIVLIMIGLIAGAFSGLMGIGGAIIMIPALVFFLQMDQHTAQGTSIAIMLPPVGLLAAYNYYKAGALNLKYAAIIAVAFIIGGYFGSKYAVNMPQETLRKIFAVLLIAIAIKMLWTRN